MKVEVMDGWRITTDTYNHTVERITKPKGEHPGGQWKTIGHYGSLARAVRGVQEYSERMIQAEGVEDVLAEMEKIKAALSAFCVKMKIDHCPCCGKEVER